MRNILFSVFLVFVFAFAFTGMVAAEQYYTVPKSAYVYKQLKEKYRIREIYYVDYLGTQYITLTDKNGLKYLFDSSATLLFIGYKDVREYKGCEGHMSEYNYWIEDSKNVIYVEGNNGVSALISEGKILRVMERPNYYDGLSFHEESGQTRLYRDGSDRDAGDFYYNQNGELLWPEPLLRCSHKGEWFIYQTIDEDTGVALYGAYNYRTKRDTIPAVYSYIYEENGDLYVHQHFYEDFVKYVPGETSSPQIAAYRPAEALLMLRYEDVIAYYNDMNEEQQKNYDLIDALISFNALSSYYYETQQHVDGAIADYKQGDWKCYFISAAAEEYLKYNINELVVSTKSITDAYDKYLEMPGIKIQKYLTRMRDEMSGYHTHFSQVTQSYYDAVVGIRKMRLASLEEEARQREIRAQEEARQQRQQDAWANVGMAILNGITNSIAGSTQKSTTTTSQSSNSVGTVSKSSSSSSSSSDSGGLTPGRRRLLEGYIRDWEKQIEEQKDILETQYKLKASGNTSATTLIRDCERRIRDYTQKIAEAKAELGQ